MKKILLLILAVSVIGGVYAQKKTNSFRKNTAAKDMSKAVWKNPNAIENIVFPLIPFKPRNVVGTNKALTSTPIGTSGNVYMCLNDAVKWINYNASLDMVSFAHRLGGPWGGASGQLRVKYSQRDVSGLFFQTMDSVQYIQSGTGLFRYPSNVIYNPPTNTTKENAFSLVCGPSTNGADWVNNFFCSQNLTSTVTNLDQNLALTASDTTRLLTDGFSGGNGKYHAFGGVQSTVTADASKTLYYEAHNGVFNTSTNKFDWNIVNIPANFKMRNFSTSVATWSAANNAAFDNNGVHGYFWTIGKDSLDNPDEAAMPIVWETTDAGATWTKNIYQGFAELDTLKYYLFPTIATWDTAHPENYVIRPNISNGSTVDENNAPGVVDKDGNLHILSIIEGLYSSNPDSLGYSYTNHPVYLFDLVKKATTWEAVFIDEIKTGFVEDANSGFGTGTDAQGWGHWFRISKSPDADKIFVTWTDTDPTIDSTNIMPEIRVVGYDVSTKQKIGPLDFSTGSGNIFYMNAPETICQVNDSTFNIPISYIDIYESGPNPLAAQKHYFMNGVQFEFKTQPNIGVTENALNQNMFVSQSYPNPTNGKASFNVTLKENSNISVVVTNILGQVIYQTSKGNASVGSHTFNMDTKNWNKGVYFYTVSTGLNHATMKMIVE